MSVPPPATESRQDRSDTRLDSRGETILAAVRARGGRVTGPRRAVIYALLSGGDHPTAEDLTARVQRTYPDVAVSTIYRILEYFEDLGVLVHVHLGHGPAVYHFSDESHVHLVCSHCGHSTALAAESTRLIAKAIRDSTAFQADLTHFSITGRCEHCTPGISAQPRIPGR